MMKEVPARREDISSLFEMLRELIPESDLDHLLEGVVRHSIQILGADRAMIFLYDSKQEALLFQFGLNCEEGMIEEAVEFSTSVIDRALRGETVVLSDSQEDQSFDPSESIFRFDIRSVLCAPMISAGELIGVIYADTKGKATILDERRKAYFELFVEFVSDITRNVRGIRERDAELTYLKRRLAIDDLLPGIIGQSPAVAALKRKILKITSVDYPVSILVLGESGTGKELVARAIHETGARSSKPLVVVNCAAIPVTLMESELFGHERGAFSGAVSRKRGLFEMADGGVIFLDEIGDLPPELQPKLLRVLQFGTFKRLGGTTELSCDVQVICATSRDLYQEMKEGRFRRDLFHRLAVEIVNIPPLRERREDILLLAGHFVRFFSEKMGKSLTGLDVRAQNLLREHDYRESNVRELRNTIERAVLNADGRRIGADDIVFSDDLLLDAGSPGMGGSMSGMSESESEPGLLSIHEGRLNAVVRPPRPTDVTGGLDKPYYRVMEEMERKLWLFSLSRTGWKIKPAAELLGISRLTFRKKLETMLERCRKECGGDLLNVSRRYGIPPRFLKSRRFGS
jgi:Nif-specific regulatory protein